MHRIARLVLVCLTCTVMAACSDEDDPVEPVPDGPISFATHIQPIFNTRCATSGCHVQPGPSADCDLSAGVSYGNLVNVPTTVFTPGVRVTPGDPSESVLYLLIKEGAMPARGPRLSSAQVTTFRKWIEEGALDN